MWWWVNRYHWKCYQHCGDSTEIDECTEGISSCNMQCVNTIGSYYCSCFLGFQLMSDNHTCEGKVNIILCMSLYYYRYHWVFK